MRNSYRRQVQAVNPVALLVWAILGPLAWANPSSGSTNGFPLRTFADVFTAWGDKSQPSALELRGFGVGTVDFFMAPNLGEGVVGLTEIAFTGSSAGFNLDVHRVKLGYEFSDSLTLWMGKFHLPISRFNLTYHHGAQFQMAFFRPKYLDFESRGVIPMHTVGILANGRIPVPSGFLIYDAFTGNGSTFTGTGNQRKLSTNIFRDDNKTLSYGGALGYQSRTVQGLKIGLQGMTDQICTTNSRANIYGAFAFYERHPLEILSEYHRFGNTDRDSTYKASFAYYVQAAYTPIDRWWPYARWELASLDQRDPYFSVQANGAGYYRGAAGLRFDVTPSAALKAEFLRTFQQAPARAAFSQGGLQYAIRF